MATLGLIRSCVFCVFVCKPVVHVKSTTWCGPTRLTLMNLCLSENSIIPTVRSLYLLRTDPFCWIACDFYHPLNRTPICIISKRSSECGAREFTSFRARNWSNFSQFSVLWALMKQMFLISTRVFGCALSNSNAANEYPDKAKRRRGKQNHLEKQIFFSLWSSGPEQAELVS